MRGNTVDNSSLSLLHSELEDISSFIMTAPPAPGNWTEYFHVRSLPGNDNDRNSSMHSHIWSSPDAEHNEKMKQLLSEEDAIVLAADACQKIIVLHSFKNFGTDATSTSLKPAENRIVCLVGGGRDVPVIRVVEGWLTAPYCGATPGVDELMACTTVDDVEALSAPDGGTDTAPDNYHGSVTFWAAPWLAHAVMNAGTQCPHELIPIAIKAASAFGKEHGVTAVDFVQWAWLVGAGNITEIKTSFDASIQFVEYRNDKHSSCLEPFLPQKPTCVWSEADNERVSNLIINATVDPTNLVGVYIVWVFRQYFPHHFDCLRLGRVREEKLLLYRKKACQFLAEMTGIGLQQGKSELLMTFVSKGHSNLNLFALLLCF